MNRSTCIICGNSKWLKLPTPHETKSITTSGVIVNEPLGKYHCCKCGFILRLKELFLGNKDFYENEYTMYYDRPGIYQFISSRYTELANWIAEEVRLKVGQSPKKILEIGCGRGWTLKELGKCFPDADIFGVEPSSENAQIGRLNGMKIITGKLEDIDFHGETYDMIYSNHVIQHTTDVIGFFKKCKKLMDKNGILMHTVQDASIPSNELMFSDQNYSFCGQHLQIIGEKAGLGIGELKVAPMNDALAFSQMITFMRNKPILHNHHTFFFQQRYFDMLYQKRKQYIEAWRDIEEFLLLRIESAKKVYNVGAGMFSFQLGCYCPNYWKIVDCCLVEGVEGDFLDKKVLKFESIKFTLKDVVVLGVRPFIQKYLYEKIKDCGADVILWDNFIEG